ncbi:unnamed protein product [Amoebophrya sp. A120]|nr:unnamed protein product [Amoebophrya sp. A120]|eukprot:GSA120T00022158001.1
MSTTSCPAAGLEVQPSGSSSSAARKTKTTSSSPQPLSVLMLSFFLSSNIFCSLINPADAGLSITKRAASAGKTSLFPEQAMQQNRDSGNDYHHNYIERHLLSPLRQEIYVDRKNLVRVLREEKENDSANPAESALLPSKSGNNYTNTSRGELSLHHDLSPEQLLQQSGFKYNKLTAENIRDSYSVIPRSFFPNHHFFRDLDYRRRGLDDDDDDSDDEPHRKKKNSILQTRLKKLRRFRRQFRDPRMNKPPTEKTVFDDFWSVLFPEDSGTDQETQETITTFSSDQSAASASSSGTTKKTQSKTRTKRSPTSREKWELEEEQHEEYFFTIDATNALTTAAFSYDFQTLDRMSRRGNSEILHSEARRQGNPAKLLAPLGGHREYYGLRDVSTMGPIVTTNVIPPLDLELQGNTITNGKSRTSSTSTIKASTSSSSRRTSSRPPTPKYVRRSVGSFVFGKSFPEGVFTGESLLEQLRVFQESARNSGQSRGSTSSSTSSTAEHYQASPFTPKMMPLHIEPLFDRKTLYRGGLLLDSAQWKIVPGEKFADKRFKELVKIATKYGLQSTKVFEQGNNNEMSSEQQHGCNSISSCSSRNTSSSSMTAGAAAVGNKSTRMFAPDAVDRVTALLKGKEEGDGTGLILDSNAGWTKQMKKALDTPEDYVEEGLLRNFLAPAPPTKANGRAESSDANKSTTFSKQGSIGTTARDVEQDNAPAGSTNKYQPQSAGAVVLEKISDLALELRNALLSKVKTNATADAVADDVEGKDTASGLTQKEIKQNKNATTTSETDATSNLPTAANFFEPRRMRTRKWNEKRAKRELSKTTGVAVSSQMSCSTSNTNSNPASKHKQPSWETRDFPSFLLQKEIQELLPRLSTLQMRKEVFSSGSATSAAQHENNFYKTETGTSSTPPHFFQQVSYSLEFRTPVLLQSLIVSGNSKHFQSAIAYLDGEAQFVIPFRLILDGADGKTEKNLYDLSESTTSWHAIDELRFVNADGIMNTASGENDASKNSSPLKIHYIEVEPAVGFGELKTGSQSFLLFRDLLQRKWVEDCQAIVTSTPENEVSSTKKTDPKSSNLISSKKHENKTNTPLLKKRNRNDDSTSEDSEDLDRLDSDDSTDSISSTSAESDEDAEAVLKSRMKKMKPKNRKKKHKNHTGASSKGDRSTSTTADPNTESAGSPQTNKPKLEVPPLRSIFHLFHRMSALAKIATSEHKTTFDNLQFRFQIKDSTTKENNQHEVDSTQQQHTELIPFYNEYDIANSLNNKNQFVELMILTPNGAIDAQRVDKQAKKYLISLDFALKNGYKMLPENLMNNYLSRDLIQRQAFLVTRFFFLAPGTSSEQHETKRRRDNEWVDSALDALELVDDDFVRFATEMQFLLALWGRMLLGGGGFGKHDEGTNNPPVMQNFVAMLDDSSDGFALPSLRTAATQAVSSEEAVEVPLREAETSHAGAGTSIQQEDQHHTEVEVVEKPLLSNKADDEVLLLPVTPDAVSDESAASHDDPVAEQQWVQTHLTFDEIQTEDEFNKYVQREFFDKLENGNTNNTISTTSSIKPELQFLPSVMKASDRLPAFLPVADVVFEPEESHSEADLHNPPSLLQRATSFLSATVFGRTSAPTQIIHPLEISLANGAKLDMFDVAMRSPQYFFDETLWAVEANLGLDDAVKLELIQPLKMEQNKTAAAEGREKEHQKELYKIACLKPVFEIEADKTQRYTLEVIILDFFQFDHETGPGNANPCFRHGHAEAATVTATPTAAAPVVAVPPLLDGGHLMNDLFISDGGSDVSSVEDDPVRRTQTSSNDVPIAIDVVAQDAVERHSRSPTAPTMAGRFLSEQAAMKLGEQESGGAIPSVPLAKKRAMHELHEQHDFQEEDHSTAPLEAAPLLAKRHAATKEAAASPDARSKAANQNYGKQGDSTTSSPSLAATPGSSPQVVGRSGRRSTKGKTATSESTEKQEAPSRQQEQTSGVLEQVEGFLSGQKLPTSTSSPPSISTGKKNTPPKKRVHYFDLLTDTPAHLLIFLAQEFPATFITDEVLQNLKAAKEKNLSLSPILENVELQDQLEQFGPDGSEFGIWTVIEKWVTNRFQKLDSLARKLVVKRVSAPVASSEKVSAVEHWMIKVNEVFDKTLKVDPKLVEMFRRAAGGDLQQQQQKLPMNKTSAVQVGAAPTKPAASTSTSSSPVELQQLQAEPASAAVEPPVQDAATAVFPRSSEVETPIAGTKEQLEDHLVPAINKKNPAVLQLEPQHSVSAHLPQEKRPSTSQELLILPRTENFKIVPAVEIMQRWLYAIVADEADLDAIDEEFGEEGEEQQPVVTKFQQDAGSINEGGNEPGEVGQNTMAAQSSVIQKTALRLQEEAHDLDDDEDGKTSRAKMAQNIQEILAEEDESNTEPLLYTANLPEQATATVVPEDFPLPEVTTDPEVFDTASTVPESAASLSSLFYDELGAIVDVGPDPVAASNNSINQQHTEIPPATTSTPTPQRFRNGRRVKTLDEIMRMDNDGVQDYMQHPDDPSGFDFQRGADLTKVGEDALEVAQVGATGTRKINFAAVEMNGTTILGGAGHQGAAGLKIPAGAASTRATGGILSSAAPAVPAGSSTWIIPQAPPEEFPNLQAGDDQLQLDQEIEDELQYQQDLLMRLVEEDKARDAELARHQNGEEEVLVQQAVQHEQEVHLPTAGVDHPPQTAAEPAAGAPSDSLPLDVLKRPQPPAEVEISFEAPPTNTRFEHEDLRHPDLDDLVGRDEDEEHDGAVTTPDVSNAGRNPSPSPLFTAAELHWLLRPMAYGKNDPPPRPGRYAAAGESESEASRNATLSTTSSASEITEKRKEGSEREVALEVTANGTTSNYSSAQKKELEQQLRKLLPDVQLEDGATTTPEPEQLVDQNPGDDIAASSSPPTVPEAGSRNHPLPVVVNKTTASTSSREQQVEPADTLLPWPSHPNDQEAAKWGRAGRRRGNKNPGGPEVKKKILVFPAVDFSRVQNNKNTKISSLFFRFVSYKKLLQVVVSCFAAVYRRDGLSINNRVENEVDSSKNGNNIRKKSNDIKPEAQDMQLHIYTTDGELQFVYSSQQMLKMRENYFPELLLTLWQQTYDFLRYVKLNEQ